MKRSPTNGALVISIDVGGEAPPSADVPAEPDERACVLDSSHWILRLLDQYRLPATWFINGPDTSLLRSHILNSRGEHEIGLLIGDSGGERLCRSAWAQSLQRRLLAARAAGVEITSVATHGTERMQHLDLLIKHGLRAVRPGGINTYEEAKRSGWNAVTILRFGIVSLPTTSQFTAVSSWRRWLNTRDLRRQIVNSAEDGQYCHWTIDIRVARDPAIRDAIERILKSSARVLESGSLLAGTVSTVATSFLQRPATVPAQSILRAA